jgi:peptidoglycan/xylan/chitin deacetylase (PgdA/CDA1 family)
MRIANPSNAHKAAMVTLAATIVVMMVHWPLSWVPPLLLVLVCAAAPFFHRCSFYLPVISSGRKDTQAVALTFDDGPDPESTPELIRLLGNHGVCATFFVVGQRVHTYPHLIREIIKAGHSLGNHSYRHDHWLAFKGKRALIEDIAATQQELERLGVVPAVYRPPVGITYPGLGPVLSELGLKAVTFSCRALDRGNFSVDHIARRILGKVSPGDIVMLHDLPPSKEDRARWLSEVSAVLEGLQARHLEVQPLQKLIGRTVDRRIKTEEV